MEAASHAVESISALLSSFDNRHLTATNLAGPGNFPLPQFQPVARFLERCGFENPGLEWVRPSGRQQLLLRPHDNQNHVNRQDITRRVDGREIRLGEIVFNGRGTNDPDFQAAFETVCAVFADTLIRSLEHAALQRREDAADRINQHSRSDLPGTAMARALGVLSSLVQSNHSFYATVDRERICLEYRIRGGRRRGRAGLIANHQPSEISEGLQEALQLGRTIEWTDARSEIETLVREHGFNPQIKCHYLIRPIKRGHDPIGAMVLGIAADAPVLTEIYRELLDSAAQKLAQAANLLFQRRFQKLIVDPVFQSRDTRPDPEQVFVLMPFTLEWSDRIWSRILQPTLEGLGLDAIRADDLYGRDVVEDIWTGILGSRFLVADITERNPNVFYELGLAHTVGKDVILLTQKVEDIPFDLNRFRHIIYEDNLDGYDKLKTGLVNSARHILEKES